MEAKVKSFKNDKAVTKDEVPGEIIKREGELVIDWIWKLCNMVIEVLV